jgi:hypothetical protein
MNGPTRDMEDLELAFFRRGVGELASACERCERCKRTPLIGERVHVYGSGTVLCELCKARHRDAPVESRLVHGPEFGHTMRIAYSRAA